MSVVVQAGWVVVPAGGSSRRFGGNVIEQANKLLWPLRHPYYGEQAVIVHTVKTLLANKTVAGVVVVGHEHWLEAYREVLAPLQSVDQPILFALGGESRRVSVLRGLEALRQYCSPLPDWVAVHDAARPNLPEGFIDLAVEPLTALWQRKEVGSLASVVGAMAATPVVDTLRRANETEDRALPVAKALVDRQGLYHIQTPQVFLTSVLLKAHELVSSEQDVTDDASLVTLAQLGDLVLLPSSPLNLKITTKADIELMNALWRS
jgi:2-C-methyl-D-erythritol 4-phosphate cytidylyltransferase